MKKIILGVLLLITTSTQLFAQDYLISKGDTTFCSDLEYKMNILGVLSSISYTDTKGQTVTIEDKQLLINAETVYQDGITMDMIPIKAHKPDKYSHFVERKIDGKLKIYLLEQELYSGTGRTLAQGSTGYIGPYIFFLKMPDGTYYQINHKSNMKKYIKPYLLQCPLFAQKYHGDFSKRQELFIDMIQLYNSLCE